MARAWRALAPAASWPCPGTPSSRTCPWHSRAIIIPVTTASWPTTALPTSSRTASSAAARIGAAGERRWCGHARRTSWSRIGQLAAESDEVVGPALVGDRTRPQASARPASRAARYGADDGRLGPPCRQPESGADRTPRLCPQVWAARPRVCTLVDPCSTLGGLRCLTATGSGSSTTGPSLRPRQTAMATTRMPATRARGQTPSGSRLVSDWRPV